MNQRSSTAPRLLRFGVFELEAQSGELRKAGARIALQEQPRKVLQLLLERAGDLITRDEFRERLWPLDTFVDFEHGLNAAVKRLRDTLGDAADSPRFVETIPRKGYRFIAPVVAGENDTHGHTSDSSRSAADSREPSIEGPRSDRPPV